MWAQWVRNKIDSFEEGGIIVCQDFMNSATMKYNKVACTTSEFNGIVHTMYDDIVAIMAKFLTTEKCKQLDADIDAEEGPYTKKQVKRDTSSFMIHWKDTSASVKYKVGEKRSTVAKHFITVMLQLTS